MFIVIVQVEVVNVIVAVSNVYFYLRPSLFT